MAILSPLLYLLKSATSISVSLLNRLKRKRLPLLDFSDEILTEILTRLPAKDVLKCRVCCRRLRTFTSTQKFLQLHCQRCPPTFIVEQWEDSTFYDYKPRLYFLDNPKKSGKLSSTKSVVKNNDRTGLLHPVPESISPNDPYFCFSSNGLLVWWDNLPSSTVKHYIFLNPITQERVRLVAPPRVIIYGVFFHPTLENNPYCVLWGGWLDSPSRAFSEFNVGATVLGTGCPDSEPQAVTPTLLINYANNDANLVVHMPRFRPPVIVNHILYWMVWERFHGRVDHVLHEELAQSPSPLRSSYSTIEEHDQMIYEYFESILANEPLPPSCEESILAFDTRTGRFSVMPHPGPKHTSCQEDPLHVRMSLLRGTNGLLSLCEVSVTSPTWITIWLSKEEKGRGDIHQQCCYYAGDGKFSWMRWCRVSVDHVDIPYFGTFGMDVSCYSVVAIAIADDELFLLWKERGVFGVNLKQGTVRRLGRVRDEYEYGAEMFEHTSSLVPIARGTSPRPDHTEIWIDLDGILT